MKFHDKIPKSTKLKNQRMTDIYNFENSLNKFLKIQNLEKPPTKSIDHRNNFLALYFRSNNL